MIFIPSKFNLQKGWMSVTKSRLFLEQSSSAAGVHVEPMKGVEKTLCINSRGVSFDDRLVDLLISNLRFVINENHQSAVQFIIVYIFCVFFHCFCLSFVVEN